MLLKYTASQRELRCQAQLESLPLEHVKAEKEFIQQIPGSRLIWSLIDRQT